MNQTTIIPKNKADLIIAAWLHAKHLKSGSQQTLSAYQRIITHFRLLLWHHHLDLDSSTVLDTGQRDDLQTIGLLAQRFAATPMRKSQVAGSTYNQRLAILSSFYSYAIKHRFLSFNPIAPLDRAKIQEYPGSVALSAEAVRLALQSIDCDTEVGARNYALLAILLQTGRRATEVLGLNWRHIQLHSDGQATLTFAHCKGNKVMQDLVPSCVREPFIAWLKIFYGSDLSHLPPESPIFVSLSTNRTRGQRLSIWTLAEICKKYLGQSKIHVTRHTWARIMLDLGATPVEIQARLGHENLATTGLYLASLKQAENRLADALAARLGLGRD